MRKLALLLIPMFFIFHSCRKEEGCTDPEAFNHDDEAELDDASCRYSLKIRFRHEVNGGALEFNDVDYSTAYDETFRVERLRYLISDLVLHRAGEEDIYSDAFHLVRIAPNNSLTYVNDPSNPSLSWEPELELPEGSYEGASFNFGFESADNITGAYGELNQATWGWPEMLGGGYHYLQFEGEYDSSGTKTKPFNMHLGTARDTSGANTTFINDHFHVELQEPFKVENGGRELDLVMELAKWFTPPPAPLDNGNAAAWRMEERPQAVMPVYKEQRTLNANGRDVFELRP